MDTESKAVIDAVENRMTTTFREARNLAVDMDQAHAKLRTATNTFGQLQEQIAEMKAWMAQHAPDRLEALRAELGMD